jgi:hypothetical protein
MQQATAVPEKINAYSTEWQAMMEKQVSGSVMVRKYFST